MADRAGVMHKPKPIKIVLELGDHWELAEAQDWHSALAEAHNLLTWNSDALGKPWKLRIEEPQAKSDGPCGIDRAWSELCLFAYCFLL
jgi:hypothetical protein